MSLNRLVANALCAVALCLLVSPRPSMAAEPEYHWYRGNTHAHTVRCGHADSEPEAVAKWYLDREYNFLCLSEHNQFIDPATVKLPDDRRKDFILIPGEEITGQNVHMTGLNMTRIVNHLIQGPNGRVIQRYTDMARALGGTPIINHPNFRWALKVSDIRPVKNCFLFELWNGHPSVNNNGDATRPSTERMWDELLTDGMLIYGMSSDDTHELKVIDRKKSNPGRGWVMVRATELTPTAIAAALDHGDFYATSGVMLKSIELTSQSLKITVDEAATKHEMAKDHVIGELLAPGAAQPGYSIEFFGPAGKLLSNTEGTEATYTRDTSLAYIRARISFVHEISGELRRHRAWTQPVFQDGRAEKAIDAAAAASAPPAAANSSR
jgi:hypothetical protein